MLSGRIRATRLSAVRWALKGTIYMNSIQIIDTCKDLENHIEEIIIDNILIIKQANTKISIYIILSNTVLFLIQLIIGVLISLSRISVEISIESEYSYTSITFLGFIILSTILIFVPINREYYRITYHTIRVLLLQPVLLGLLVTILLQIPLPQSIIICIYIVIVSIAMYPLLLSVIWCSQTITPWEILILLDPDIHRNNKSLFSKLFNFTMDIKRIVNELEKIYLKKNINWNIILEYLNIRKNKNETSLQMFMFIVTTITILGVFAIINPESIRMLINNIIIVFDYNINLEVLMLGLSIIFILIMTIILLYLYQMFKRILYINKINQISNYYALLRKNDIKKRKQRRKKNNLLTGPTRG